MFQQDILQDLVSDFVDYILVLMLEDWNGRGGVGLRAWGRGAGGGVGGGLCGLGWKRGIESGVGEGKRFTLHV